MADIKDLPAVNETETLEILDAPDAENEEVTFENLYSFLLREGDIIITIDAEQEENVRRGLSVVKSRHQKKLREANNKQKEKVMKFNVVEQIPNSDPPQIRLQVWLQERSGVFVHRLVVSDKGL